MISLEAAKVIGAMAVSGKSPAKLVGMLKVGKPMLPLFAIPTTAGTGSEVTVAAVVTDPVKHVKSAVIDPKLVPLAAALAVARFRLAAECELKKTEKIVEYQGHRADIDTYFKRLAGLSQ